MFEEYLRSIDPEQRAALQEHVIAVVEKEAPGAEEGLSYGLPAFFLKKRSLIGFSSNKHGLNVYPFDPKIVQLVIDEFPSLDHSKGVIRFTPEKPIPKKAVILMTHLRLKEIGK